MERETLRALVLTMHEVLTYLLNLRIPCSGTNEAGDYITRLDTAFQAWCASVPDPLLPV